eukprot:tig00020723_g13483.t1
MEPDDASSARTTDAPLGSGGDLRLTLSGTTARFEGGAGRGLNGLTSPSQGLSPSSRVRIASNESARIADDGGTFSVSSAASSFGDLEANRSWGQGSAGGPHEEASPVGDGAGEAACGPISAVLNKRRKSTPRVTFAEPEPPEPPERPEGDGPGAPAKPRRPSTPGPSGRAHALAKGGVPKRPVTPGPGSYAKALAKGIVRFSEEGGAQGEAGEAGAEAEGAEGGEEARAPGVPKLRRPATPGPSAAAARERRRSLPQSPLAQPQPPPDAPAELPAPAARAGPDAALDGRVRLSLPESLNKPISVEDLARRVTDLSQGGSGKSVRIQLDRGDDSEGSSEGSPAAGAAPSTPAATPRLGRWRGRGGGGGGASHFSSPESGPVEAPRQQGRRLQVRSSIELSTPPPGWSADVPAPPSRPPTAALGRRSPAAPWSAMDLSGPRGEATVSDDDEDDEDDDGGDSDDNDEDGGPRGRATAWGESHAALAARRRSLPHVLPPSPRPGAPSRARDRGRNGHRAGRGAGGGTGGGAAGGPPTARQRALSLPRSHSMQAPVSPSFEPWEDGEPWGAEGWRDDPRRSFSRPNTARGAAARRPSASGAALPSVVGPEELPALVSRLNALMEAFESPGDALAPPSLGSRRPSHEPPPAPTERLQEPRPPSAALGAPRPGHRRHLSSGSTGFAGDPDLSPGAPPPSSPPRTYLRPHTLVPSPSAGARSPSPSPTPPPLPSGRPRFNSDEGASPSSAGPDRRRPRRLLPTPNRGTHRPLRAADGRCRGGGSSSGGGAGAGARRQTLPALGESNREKLSELVTRLSEIQQGQATPRRGAVPPGAPRPAAGTSPAPRRPGRRARRRARRGERGGGGAGLEVRDVEEEDLRELGIYEDTAAGSASSGEEGSRPRPPPRPSSSARPAAAPAARPAPLPATCARPARPAPPRLAQLPSQVHDALRRISDLVAARRPPPPPSARRRRRRPPRPSWPTRRSPPLWRPPRLGLGGRRAGPLPASASLLRSAIFRSAPGGTSSSAAASFAGPASAASLAPDATPLGRLLQQAGAAGAQPGGLAPHDRERKLPASRSFNDGTSASRRPRLGVEEM